MGLPVIKVVDILNNNEPIEINELTQTGLGALIYECERLLDELKDAMAKVKD